MTNLVESTETETLVELTDAFVLEVATESMVIEVTESGPDIVAQETTTETLTELQTETVYAVEPEIILLEVGEQGPPGPAGGTADPVPHPGKTLVYTGSLLTEVLSYLDAAKTILAERRVLAYAGSVLSSIQFFNGSGVLTKTRTLSYSGGVLVGVVDA